MKKLYFCFSIIFAALFSNFIFGAIPASERAALIALYNSTNGDSWTNKSGWKTPPLDTDGFAMPGTEGSWYGVSLSGDHVTKLLLESNKLIGNIPSELGNLSQLNQLILYRNQLSGTIPPELGNLSLLTSLILGDNNLSGSIPSELGNLSHLNLLYLNNNVLSGAIPSQLGNLNLLTSLVLGDNNLNGSIPSELGNLSNLEELLLYNNQLTGAIPSELSNLTNLKDLHLNHNQLTGGIPSELGNLSNLEEHICLHSNQLSGGIPSQLGNLSRLKGLYLYSNHLSGSIPSQLGNLSNLENFNLSMNQLSGSIPTELGNLSYLSMLYLYDNQLSGSIPPELGNLSNLTHLSLENNHLSGSIPFELGNLSNLQQLYLDYNHLSGVIPSSFINLKNIPPYIPSAGYSVIFNYNCLSATDSTLRAWLNSRDPEWEVTQNQCAGKTSIISLNHSQLNFGFIISGSIPKAQTVLISHTGGNALNWNASGNATWLSVSPSSGTGNSSVLVSIDPNELAVGNYTGAILITDSNASNSPQPITVSLHVYDQGETSAPFGEFATPSDGSSVYNSIPITGWVLDDIGIANVKIYNGDAYVGSAVFIEEARPDVEVAFPTYPNNYKAGWGYMLLTHFLPDGGNGTYTLIAKATDMEGNEVTLGSKAITIDNAHAVKPFGAIDTPTQGGTASGKNFVNYGWALTPQPNMIPSDGSTINVFIDGAVKGHPVYNVFRSDIAFLFPVYTNSDGAVGHYFIDTTKLSNGVHTIAWTVTDNAGNSDGIGSRYFSVMNTGAGDQAVGGRGQGSGVSDERRGEPPCSPVFDPFSPVFDPHSPAFDETKIVEIKELERVEINLSVAEFVAGYSLVGDQLRGLPIGSTLDKERGVFYWQPGPGFVGEYRLVFIGKDNDGQLTRKNIVVTIKPGH